MSLFATLDIDLPEDPAYIDLYDAHPGHPWRMIRLVSLAKRANQRGRILRTDGVPLDARALARIHDGRGSELVELWESFLALCIKLGLLLWNQDDACYQIRHWRRGHRSESDMPEARRERKRRSRDREVRQAPRRPVEPPPRDNTPREPVQDSIPADPPRDMAQCHGCHDTEQSIAEHSRDIAEHHHRADAREAVNDDFCKRNDVTKRIMAAGVSELEARRFARDCNPAIIEPALQRARGPGIRNPAAYLARELAQGGFAPPVDRGKMLRDRHEQVARQRRAVRQSDAADAERSAGATQAACERFERLPEPEKRRVLAQHREQAERDSFCHVSGWGPGHPLWRGLLAEVMQRAEAMGA